MFGQKTAVAAACSILISACATTTAPVAEVIASPVAPDARFTSLRDEFKTMVDRGELVSLAIGVVADGQVVWAETFGWSDLEANASATLDTRYGVASLGKSVTATAAMTLVGKKRLSLDARVTDILGKGALKDYADSASPTVRQLLDMTSGIPHGALTYSSPDHPSEEDVMKERAMVVFEPGATFHYSNFSIAVLDEVIEKKSKMSFPEFVRESVFDPLGMTSASVGEAAGLVAPAAKYDSSGARIGAVYPLPRSSRQMQASLRDMLKYAAFQLHAPLPGAGRALSDASIDQMHNERSKAPGAHMALGWASMDLGGGERWLISSGNDMGVQSSLTLLPEKKVGVIVLTNTSGYQADEIGIRIADAAAPGVLEKAIAAIGAFEGQTQAYAASPEWVGEWFGFVKGADGNIPAAMSFGADGSVSVVLGDAPAAPLEEASVRHGLLTGAFEGELPLEERAGKPHRVEIGLQKNGDELQGFMLANFRSDRGKFEIPAYARLTRQR